MTDFNQIASSNLSLPADSYIYSLITLSKRLESSVLAPGSPIAVISSDDSLRIFDADLNLLPDGIYENIHNSITCVSRFDDDGNIIATAGRDACVKLWDRRTKSKVAEFVTPKKEALSALNCCASNNAIVAGTELKDDGPGESPIFLWDTRKGGSPQLQYVESHTDTITELRFNSSTNPTHLLSGSTDGLINLFDLSQDNEDDALFQVINNKSAIHHTGFLTSTSVYTLSTDEKWTQYEIRNPDEEDSSHNPEESLDLRERLGCEYVIKVVDAGDAKWVAIGQHRQSYSRLNFAGAHGNEIVRDVLVDASTIYSCGEDGHIRAWKASSTGEAMETEGTEKASKDKKKKHRKKDKEAGKEARFAPY
ncbi:WD40 repeat-like protein [Patellaria atrata CBS 101060]|uniref:WD40 repeat-like protein n=1 Tax=Patellaria atrata CBS 101060 TaxID=1346257 RepID=A0A9P4SGB9_9PEZI|nr:WD40 repeat-like protein [Patellaria atrata CBS 101060]